jgi:hypothetical protein
MTTADREYLAGLITSADNIAIVSGEGDGEGAEEDYTGAKSLQGLRARLTRERCGGDRWAYASLDGQRCWEI